MSAANSILGSFLEQFPAVHLAYRGIQIHMDNRRLPKSFAPSDLDQEILGTLLQQGYAVLPDFFDAGWCKACVEAIDKVIAEHPEYVRKREDERLFGAQNINAQLMEFHNHPRLQKLADLYYGQPSGVGVSMANRIGTLPGQTLGSGGDWHRDRLLRQFKTIVYLEDVTENDGPFQFIEGSHTHHEDQFKADTRITGLSYPASRLTDTDVQRLIKQQPERLKTFTAKKGTVILVDTSGIHRGSPVKGGKRYAVFNYYYTGAHLDPEKLNRKFAPILPEGFKL